MCQAPCKGYVAILRLKVLAPVILSTSTPNVIHNALPCCSLSVHCRACTYLEINVFEEHSICTPSHEPCGWHHPHCVVPSPSSSRSSRCWISLSMRLVKRAEVMALTCEDGK